MAGIIEYILSAQIIKAYTSITETEQICLNYYSFSWLCYMYNYLQVWWHNRAYLQWMNLLV